MRKGHDGKWEKTGEEKRRRVKIIATTSLPAVDRPNADRHTLAPKECRLYWPLTLLPVNRPSAD